MFIKTTYVGYYKETGIKGMWCGFKPDGVVITEELFILFPEVGFELERISDKKRFSAIRLKEGDTKDNYIEIEIEI